MKLYPIRVLSCLSRQNSTANYEVKSYVMIYRMTPSWWHSVFLSVISYWYLLNKHRKWPWSFEYNSGWL